MFAQFRSLFDASLCAAILMIAVVGSATGAQPDDQGFSFTDTPGFTMDADLDPLWIVYWWRAGDPQSSYATRSMHNCGRGALGKAYARQLQRELIEAGFSAVIAPQYGE